MDRALMYHLGIWTLDEGKVLLSKAELKRKEIEEFVKQEKLSVNIDEFLQKVEDVKKK
ncbi:hypothetical protein [Persephonella sp.]